MLGENRGQTQTHILDYPLLSRGHAVFAASCIRHVYFDFDDEQELPPLSLPDALALADWLVVPIESHEALVDFPK